jgi:hypothetical protein
VLWPVGEFRDFRLRAVGLDREAVRRIPFRPDELAGLPEVRQPP